MKIIKASTKKGQGFIARANRYEGTELSNIYGSYSRAKKNAYEYCRMLYIRENGNNFHIISYNTFGFSVAWTTPDGFLRIETPNNSYCIDLNA